MLTFTEAENPAYPYAVQKNGRETHALKPVDLPGYYTHRVYQLETIDGRPATYKRCRYWVYIPTDDDFWGMDTSERHHDGAKIDRA